MATTNLGAVTAYGIARKNGFTGTEAEWLESLKQNSNALTFTGGATATYDGSKEVTVKIPAIAQIEMTISASSWSGLACTVTDSALAADDSVYYLVSPASSSREAYGSAGIYADDVTTAGQMTFHCTTAPTEDITVYVLKITG